MASGKNSFVLYCDLIHTVEKLPDDIAGILFKTVLAYVNDQKPEPNNLVVQIAFEPIKQQLKRDLREWEITRLERSESGIIGNLKRWYPDIFKKYEKGKIDLQTAINEADSRKISPPDNLNQDATNGIAKIAVSVNDTVTVTDNVNVNVTEGVYKSPDGSTHTPDQIELFNQFSEWLGKHFPRVTRMKKPITIDQYLKLRETISREILTKLLTAMENRADLHKKYVSAYLTIINWSKNEFNQPEPKQEQGSVLAALKNVKQKGDAA